MNKRFLAGIGMCTGLALVLLSGCGMSKDKVDPGLAIVVPESSELVFAFDYTDSAQVDQLHGLFAQFPQESYDVLKESLSADLTSQDKSEMVDYLAMLKPFMTDDWELVAGVVMGDAQASDVDKGIIAAKFAKDDEFEEFLRKMIVKSGKKFEESEKNGVKYWESAGEKLYIARVGEVFLLSSGRDELDLAISRLNEGKGGFAETDAFEKLQGMAEEKFGYVYLSEAFTKKLEQEGGGMSVGDIYAVVKAEDSGIRTLYSQNVGDALNQYAKTDFMAKLPDQNVFFFAQINAFFDQLYAEVPAELKEYEELFGVPVAFVSSDKGVMYPTMSLYFDLAGKNPELAKSFLNKIDGYTDLVIEEFDSLIAGSGYEGMGLLKREVESVKGAPMRKLYLDFSVIPPAILNGVRVYVPTLDFDNLKVEFYYGVDSNGMLVFALYPGLDKEDGKAVLADNKLIKKAVGMLALKDLDSLSYVDFTPLFVIADGYVEMFKGSQFVSAEEMAEAEKIYNAVKGLVETVDYVVEGSSFEGGVLSGESYFAIVNAKK